MLFDVFRKWVVGGTKTDAGASQTHYDVEYEIADVIDTAPLEMLSNKETRIILFQDPTNDNGGAARVCLSSTRKFSPGKELAEVYLNTLEGFEKFLDLRRQRIPSRIQAHFLAMDAVSALSVQSGLFNLSPRKRNQRSRQSYSS